MNSELLIDGKKYISSKRSSHMGGYTIDYIGRLCREGKVVGKLVSRTWYVDEESLKDFLELIDKKKNLKKSFQSKIGTEVYRTRNVTEISNTPILSFSSPKLFEVEPIKSTFSPLVIISEVAPLFPELIGLRSLSQINSSPESDVSLESADTNTTPTSIAEISKYKSFTTSDTDVSKSISKYFDLTSGSRKILLKTVGSVLIALLLLTGFYYKNPSVALLADKNFASSIPRGFIRVAEFGTAFFDANLANGFLNYPTELPSFSKKEFSNKDNLAATSNFHVSFLGSIQRFFSSYFSTLTSIFSPSGTSTSKTVATNDDVKIRASIEEIERTKTSLLSERDTPVVAVGIPVTSSLPKTTQVAVAPKALNVTGTTKIIERIINRILVPAPLATGGITREELDAKLQQLSNKFSSDITRVVGGNTGTVGSLSSAFQAIALTSRIDQLSGVTFSGGSINGTSILNSTFNGSNVSATTASFGSLTISNFTATSTFGNFSGGFATVGNLFITGSSTLQNFTALNSTSTNATTTNSFATTASSTNLFATFANFGTTVISGLSSLANLLVTGSSTLQNFTALNSTSTNATTTNSFATTASSTNLFATNANFGNFGGGFATLGNLYSIGSSTLQNFTALNSTSTNATTTNSFATTASSTNLFSSLLTVGSNALVVNASGNVGIGTTNPVSSLEIPGSTTNSSAKFGSYEIQTYGVNNAWLGENMYFNGGFKLRSNGYGSIQRFISGVITTETTNTTGVAGSYPTLTTITRAGIATGGLPQFSINAAIGGTYQQLLVNTSATNDALSSAQINAFNSSVKALVVQGAISPAVDIFNVQKSDGTVYLNVDKNGSVGTISKR
jgi:hypothetical protein